MTWKRVVALGFAALLASFAVALIYPGIPAGMDINSNNYKVVLTCSYLHWDGLHRRTITIPNPSGVYTFARSDCSR